jgi:hypothetical protein
MILLSLLMIVLKSPTIAEGRFSEPAVALISMLSRFVVKTELIARQLCSEEPGRSSAASDDNPKKPQAKGI